MDQQRILAWGGLLAILIIACWNIYENGTLKQKIKSARDLNTSQWFIHFAWARTIQLLFVSAFAALFIISYDMQLTTLRNDVRKLRSDITEKVTLLNKQSNEISKNLAATAHILPSIAVSAPVNTVQPAPDQKVEELYNPEKSSADAQSRMDEIKKRYENILVIHMFLKRCDKVKPIDYDIIIHGLTQEMALVGAPPHMQYDIISSAQGSYKEIYSDSPCESTSMDALLAQYNNYITLLSTHFPMQ